MHTIYERVCGWNSLRYQRKHNMELSVKLLREEHHEWLTAKTDVAKLDALCDIIFVAMGVLWKIDVEPQCIDDANNNAQRVLASLLNSNELQPAFLIATHLDVFEYDIEYPIVDSMAMMINAAMLQIIGMGLTYDLAQEALLIVCDSNDSKTIARVSETEKYSKFGKGDNYVSPVLKLQELLKKRVEL